MTVIQFQRPPAYTPLDDPGLCQTPGHGDRPARSYPGGRLCDRCIEASRQAYRSSDDETGAA